MTTAQTAQLNSVLARCGRAAMPSDLAGISRVIQVARATSGFPQQLLWDLEDAFEAAAQADFEGAALAAGLC